LKPLLKALKPPPSRGNSTSLTGTAPIGTALAGVVISGIIDNGISGTDISISLYELNKLNIRKPGFIKDREMIIGYKFKYFRKGDKKG